MTGRFAVLIINRTVFLLHPCNTGLVHPLVLPLVVLSNGSHVDLRPSWDVIRRSRSVENDPVFMINRVSVLQIILIHQISLATTKMRFVFAQGGKERTQAATSPHVPEDPGCGTDAGLKRPFPWPWYG